MSNDIVIKELFEPCDLCSFPDPSKCPAAHHEFYCEYLEAEIRKPEHLRYYTRRLAGITVQTPHTPKDSQAETDSDDIKQKQASISIHKTSSRSVTMTQWDLAHANVITCIHRKMKPRIIGECCKFSCAIGKGKNPQDVKKNECQKCQLIEIGAITA